MKRLASALVACIALPCSALAQWMDHVEEDPFRGNQRIGLATEGLHVMGFACSNADDLKMLFVVPERHQPSNNSLLKAPFRLLVIVDDRPKVTLAAYAQVVPATGAYRFVSDDGDALDVMRDIARARRRVAVAVELMGQVVDSKQFGVRGSGRVLDGMIAGCKLPTS